MTWSAGLFLNYANRPFVVESCAARDDCVNPNPVPGREEDVLVVENLATADLLGSFTPIPIVQVGLKIPVTFVDGQGLTEEGFGNVDDPIGAVGLGDILLEGKVRAWGEVDDPFVVGGALFTTLHTGTLTSEGNFIGDSTPTLGLRGIFDGAQGPFSFGGNLAGVFRGSGRVGSTELGHEFRYGIGAGYRPSPIIRIIVDSIGSTKFSAKEGTNALEIDAAGQFTPLNSSFTITGGGGLGVIEGVGVPTFRAIVGVMYVAEAKDRDGDGLLDEADQCPTIAEDLDGFQDEDGCPDQDNDGDTIADGADRCPDQPEDPDAFEDTDGCPEADNDGDGIDDNFDRCPDERETKNGYQDEDGCPDVPDTDNDGVPDPEDQCIDGPEDTDGFEDTDGCPDPDNDGDGIPDERDECVDQPETVNGFEDEDGCPDENPEAEEGEEGDEGAAAPE